MTALRNYQSLEDAIDEGFQRALAGQTTREAATEVYNRGIRPDELSTLAIRGLATFIAARLSSHADSWTEDDSSPESDMIDGPQSTARGRLSVVGRHYAREHWERVLSVKNYEGADGTRKALLDFTATDASLLLTVAKSRAEGYMKVAEAMRRALEYLATHKAVTVAGLPVKAKQAIAEAVA